MIYNWQQKDWPNFKYNLSKVEDNLFAFAEETGHITGVLNGMPEDLQTETMISIMVSEAIGKEKIHFEAPPSSRIPGEMQLFIKWFNDTAPGEKKEIKKAPIRSAIAHLYMDKLFC